jgi:transcriptional regulator with XRE-family HTH domain/tetratricopeptide (TPR) repeat protein
MTTRSSGSRRPGAFASALRLQRETAGLTQAELAEQAGLGVRTVSNLERGINTSPYPSTVRVLADALGLAEESRADLLRAARRSAVSDGSRARPTGGYLGSLPAAELVAREAERTAIVDALAAVSAGEGRIVLLTGEPGIGKTRLAQETNAYAEERGFLVATGRCYQPQSGAPFTPWFEAFAMLHDAAPAAVRDGIIERWPALVTLLPDQFPSVEPPPTWTSPDAEQVLYRAATGLVRELAEHQPVAILVDDLHWADAATLELLTHLARHTAADRVLLLGTYRDAEVGSAHPLRRLAHSLHRERRSQAINVGRFDRDATARLITQRLDESQVSEELSDLVHRHSDGNPFFTGEIVTVLIERGDLAQVDGQWVCRELAALEAPAQVSELIGQRVSRLSSAARGVLEAASVLGAVFDPEDVAVVDAEEDLLEASLDEAVESGLLMIADDRYAFDHSLTQQALYAGLSPVRRRRLHRAAGERLEGRPAAARRRRSAEIARHWEEGGVRDRAIPFILMAGDVAAGVYSQGEAMRLYDHARALAEAVGDETTVTSALERIGQVELSTGRYDDALDHLGETAQRYRRAGDVESLMRVEGMIAGLQHRRGEGEAAAGRLDDLLAELEIGTGPNGWAAGGAVLANGLARVRLSLGQHELCVEAAELATRLAQVQGSPAAEADACAVGGTALLFLDRPDDAVRVLEEGVKLAAGIDDPMLESTAMMGLQWALTMGGELAEALVVGERGLALTRRLDNADMESHFAAGLGHTLYYIGDWDESQQHLEHSLQLARAGSPTLFSVVPPVYLGLLRAGQGDTAAAIACYDEAATAPDLQTFAFPGYLQARRAELDLRDGDAAGALARLEPWLDQESPTKVHDVMLLVAASEACLALGDIDRGERLVERALRRAAATRNVVDGIDALRLQGRVHALRGKSRQARGSLDEALERAVAIHYPAAEQRVRSALVELGRS